MPMSSPLYSNEKSKPAVYDDDAWWNSPSTHELVLPVPVPATVSVPAVQKFFERSLLEADTVPTSVGRVLPILWAIIGLVCAYDVYLSVKYPDFLKHLEENPLGMWLISLDGGSPALFMAVKFASSMIVMSVLILSHRWYSRLCLVLTVPVALYQLCLMAYLTFA